MEAETKLKQAKSSLEDWAYFKTQFTGEAEKFKLACQQRQEQADARILHDLSEASRIAKLGAAAAEAYSKTYLSMPAPGSMVLETGAAVFTKLLQDTALLEQAVNAPIPSLILWDLNGIPAGLLNGHSVDTKLCQQLQLMKELLTARPQHTMGMLLLRRVQPAGLTKRAFHSAICSALEAKGIDCDLDVALNFKEVPRPANSIFSLSLMCCILHFIEFHSLHVSTATTTHPPRGAPLTTCSFNGASRGQPLAPRGSLPLTPQVAMLSISTLGLCIYGEVLDASPWHARL